MKKKLTFYLFMLYIPIMSFAQMTIGSNILPANGAILQLKQWESQDNTILGDISNSNKGLGLPRVELKTLESLEPFISPLDTDYEEQKKLHVGLLVFNLTDDSTKDLSPRIYIWNGSLWKEYVLKTSQLSLEVTPDIATHNFDVLNPQPLNLNVKWQPAAISTEFIIEERDEGGLRGLNSIPAQTDGSGNFNISIKPTAVTQAELDTDPLIGRTSEIYIRTSNGSGRYLMKNILLKQISYGAIVEGFDPYMEMGRDYYITIKSNTAWKMELNSPKGVSNTFEIQEIPTDGSGAVAKEGVNYKIRLKEDINLEGDIIKLIFSSPEGTFVDNVIQFTPTRTYANAYFIEPGAQQIVPANKAYIVWANDQKQALPATVTFTPELVWEDAEGLISDIQMTGSGINSLMTIKTSSTANVDGGNAVVAIKYNDEIVWSWHLWVTKYNPNITSSNIDIDYTTISDNHSTKVATKGGDVYSYYNGKLATKFMDRDLGASTVFRGLNENQLLGLYYQWGRKDPIPGPDVNFKVNGSLVAHYNHKKIYNSTGILINDDGEIDQDLVTGVNHIQVEPLGITNAIPLTIKDPLTMYYGGTSKNDYDWYGSFVAHHRSDLWTRSDNTKGLYDPCPQGWRVVPTGAGLDNPFYGIDFPNLEVKTVAPYKLALDATSSIGYIVFSGQYDVATKAKFAAFNGATLLRTSTSAGSRNFSLSVASTPVGVVKIYARSHASAIRCVKYYQDSNF